MSDSSRKPRNGGAAFAALEGEVREALAARRTLRAIYDEKKKRLSMSYSQFARYAQRLRARMSEAPSTAPRSLPARHAPIFEAAADARAVGPPRARPANPVPNLKMDRYATEVLDNEDLF